MPAKIRTIRGLKNPDNTINFGKSIGPRGGTEGLIVFQPSQRATKIRLYQDKNEDGKFSKRDLIFKGKTSDATYDELINTSRVKFTRQVHSCDWDIMKGNKPIVCTLDFVPTLYTLTLTTPSLGKVVPEGMGNFANSQMMILNDPLSDLLS